MISNFSSTVHLANSKLLLIEVLSLDVYSYRHQKLFFPIMGIGVAPHKALRERRMNLLLCNRKRQSKAKSLINLPVKALLEYIITLSLH